MLCAAGHQYTHVCRYACKELLLEQQLLHPTQRIELALTPQLYTVEGYCPQDIGSLLLFPDISSLVLQLFAFVPHSAMALLQSLNISRTVSLDSAVKTRSSA